MRLVFNRILIFNKKQKQISLSSYVLHLIDYLSKMVDGLNHKKYL